MIKSIAFAILLLIILSFGGLPASGHGIVIAHEKQQTELFNSDSMVVSAFVDSLALKYDKVILHLGNAGVFRRGNIFTSAKSKKNLKFFAEKLQSKNMPLTLWFFDSFGKENFEKLYSGYAQMCDENFTVLDSLKLPYEGIAIDMEWINHENGDNNSKLEEVLGYLRKKLNKDHKLCFFASLHETKKENVRRGFTTDRLLRIADAPIAMLYPSEAGFHLEGQRIRPNLDDKRIKLLTQFYDKEKWRVAVSLESKWICQLRHDLTEMELLSTPPAITSDKLKADQSSKEGFWDIESYTVVNPLLVNLEKDKKTMLNPGDKIYHYTINQAILSPNYYIWEYYNLQSNFLSKE